MLRPSRKTATTKVARSSICATRVQGDLCLSEAVVFRLVVIGSILPPEVANLLAEPASELFFSEDAAEQAKALEDRDYYSSANVFWVPQPARSETLRNQAKQPEIGRLLDDALVAIEDVNPLD